MRKAFSVVFVLLLFGGCASAPVRYYSLENSPENILTAITGSCCRVKIKNISLPPAVDRSEIVARGDDDQMLVLSNDLWIAPLRDEIKAAFANSIRENLTGFGRSDTGAGDAVLTSVRIDVERFDAAISQFVLVRVVWQIAFPIAGHDLTAVCQSSNKVSIGIGVPELVRGYRQAIVNIGAQIALGIHNLEVDGENACGPGYAAPNH